ncbi:MAG: transglycosylase SLT domain-containing protein [Patescibacteria group bacterium]
MRDNALRWMWIPVVVGMLCFLIGSWSRFNIGESKLVAGRAAVSMPTIIATPYDELTQTAAQKHGVDPDLVRAVIAVESGFDPKAESPKGAQGLMQLMPGTARQYGVTDAFDPKQNIDAGTEHLSGLLKKYELERALAAYNAGEAGLTSGLPDETKAYIANVSAIWRDYREKGADFVRIVSIRLIGGDKPSKDFLGIDTLPTGWNYRWYGPSNTRARFEDGKEFSLTEDVGARGGRVRFLGPAGERVTIRVAPPG